MTQHEQGKHVALHPQSRQRETFSLSLHLGVCRGFDTQQSYHVLIFYQLNLSDCSWWTGCALTSLKPLLLCAKRYEITFPTFVLEWRSYSIWREFSLRNLSSTLVTKNRPWDMVTVSREQITPVLPFLCANHFLTQQPEHHFPKLVCTGRHTHGHCCQLNDILGALTLGQYLIPPQIPTQEDRKIRARLLLIPNILQ